MRRISFYMSDEKYLFCTIIIMIVTIEENVKSVRVGTKVFGK